MSKYFLGIDIGTQGARVILVNQLGQIFGSGSRKFILDDASREEQSPDMWWKNCVEILDDIFLNLDKNINKSDIIAVSVTSTS